MGTTTNFAVSVAKEHQNGGGKQLIGSAFIVRSYDSGCGDVQVDGREQGSECRNQIRDPFEVRRCGSLQRGEFHSLIDGVVSNAHNHSGCIG